MGRPETPKKKASVGQVAATMFFALIAIGKRDTWHRDGATVTFFQVVVGAFVGLAIILVVLVSLALLATR